MLAISADDASPKVVLGLWVPHRTGGARKKDEANESTGRTWIDGAGLRLGLDLDLPCPESRGYHRLIRCA